jgi:hypothetical protein
MLWAEAELATDMQQRLLLAVVYVELCGSLACKSTVAYSMEAVIATFRSRTSTEGPDALQGPAIELVKSVLPGHKEEEKH